MIKGPMHSQYYNFMVSCATCMSVLVVRKLDWGDDMVFSAYDRSTKRVLKEIFCGSELEVKEIGWCGGSCF